MAKQKPTSDDIGVSDPLIESNDDPVGSSGTIETVAGIEVTSPGATKSSGAGDSSEQPRKRGRPAGSGAAKPAKEKAAQVSIKGIEKILFSLHMIVAKSTGIEELELDTDESKLLADAVAEVASHYNYKVDPKTIAWMGLIGVAGSIYGPRVGAYSLRRSMEKGNKKVDIKGAPAKVSPIFDASFVPNL